MHSAPNGEREHIRCFHLFLGFSYFAARNKQYIFLIVPGAVRGYAETALQRDRCQVANHIPGPRGHID